MLVKWEGLKNQNKFLRIKTSSLSEQCFLKTYEKQNYINIFFFLTSDCARLGSCTPSNCARWRTCILEWLHSTRVLHTMGLRSTRVLHTKWLRSMEDLHTWVIAPGWGHAPFLTLQCQYFIFLKIFLRVLGWGLSMRVCFTSTIYIYILLRLEICALVYLPKCFTLTLYL